MPRRLLVAAPPQIAQLLGEKDELAVYANERPSLLSIDYALECILACALCGPAKFWGWFLASGLKITVNRRTRLVQLPSFLPPLSLHQPPIHPASLSRCPPSSLHLTSNHAQPRSLASSAVRRADPVPGLACSRWACSRNGAGPRFPEHAPTARSQSTFQSTFGNGPCHQYARHQPRSQSSAMGTTASSIYPATTNFSGGVWLCCYLEIVATTICTDANEGRLSLHCACTVFVVHPGCADDRWA